MGNSLFNLDSDSLQELDNLDKSRIKALLKECPSPDDHWLIVHAAFPVALTSDLLYKIWVNFRTSVKNSNGETSLLVVPQILLSSICHETSKDLYEIYPSIRGYLLQVLQQNTIWGPKRLEELAKFLYAYVDQCSNRIPSAAFAEAQRWTAEAYLQPDKAAEKLLQTITEGNEKGWVGNRISYYISLAEQMGLGVARKENELNYNGNYNALRATLDIAKGVQYYKEGNFTKAQEKLEVLKNFIKEPGVNLDNQFQTRIPQQVLDKINSSKNIKPKLEPKLYALLVAINEYPEGNSFFQDVHFPPLKGCVSDAINMKEYLQRYAPLKIQFEILINREATKANIVKQFREHLGQAREDDVVLFYYSGHGATEYADTSIWSSETDSRLECIPCYFDYETKDDFLLADKELRFLIKELSVNKPHIVTILDCCYSAENTSNGPLLNVAFKELKEKRIPFTFPQREWGKFIFNDHLTYEQVKTLGEANAIPEGLHVQLAASLEKTSAYEKAGEGVFTNALLQVLNQTGKGVSYKELVDRMHNSMYNVFEQQPKLYIPGFPESLLFTPFLNQKLNEQNDKAITELIFDSYKNEWFVKVGTEQGVNLETKIELVDPKDLNKIYSLKITHLESKLCYLALDKKEDFTLDINFTYKAIINSVRLDQLRIHLHNYDGNPDVLNELVRVLTQDNKKEIIFVRNENAGNYVLHVRNGFCYFTQPGNSFRPLIAPVNISDSDAPYIVTRDLEHISKWEFIKNLTNQDSGSRLNSDALRVKLFRVSASGEKQPLDVRSGEAVINYEQIEGEWKSAISVRLTNTTTVNLYCSALYLTSTFGSFLGFLNPEVYLLEAGNSVELSIDGNSVIDVYLEEFIRLYNWQEQVEHLKFIYSTELFNAKDLYLDDLPKPDTPNNKQRGLATRGLVRGLDRRKVAGWTTSLITLRLRNPKVNTIKESELAAMLQDLALTDFALELFFNASVSENLEPVYQLKQNIKIIEGGQSQEMNFVDKWARLSRNRLYFEVIKRFPERLRIVSLGDTWFQHPLLLDITDHLSKAYAIYSLATNGHNIRDYFSLKTQNENYTDAINREKPHFFLISGGASNLLGSQLHLFLNNSIDYTLPEGEEPRRFLNDSLFVELDRFKEDYWKVVSHLNQTNPDLHIIIHGYDYPVKLNFTKEGWLGRFMIEKGINRLGDRIAIIQLILDKFNEMLKEVANANGNLSYIDLRNTIRYEPSKGIDQWYDEIHPNNEGFQEVAMKFIKCIEGVLNKDVILGPPSPTEIALRKIEEVKNKKSLELILDGLQLNDIPEVVFDLPYLQLLSVQNNKLTKLPKKIGQLHNLRTLKLCYNRFSRLPEEILDLEKLEILDVRNNKLKELPHAIGRLKQLNFLRLSHNCLKQLPESIASLTKLRDNTSKEQLDKGLLLEGNLFPFEIPSILNKKDIGETVKFFLENQRSFKELEQSGIRTILWVDDNPNNNTVPSNVLKGLGFYIYYALSTKEALQYLENVHFDLLITDLSRRGDKLAGIDLLKKLNESKTRKNIPVIVYSSSKAIKQYGKQAENLGASSIVDDPKSLIERVKSLLKSNRNSEWAFKNKWVLVVGTGTHKLSEAENLASEVIGKLLAKEGYGLISGGWPGTDYVTAKAYAETIKNFGILAQENLIQYVFHEPDFKGGTIYKIKSDLEWYETALNKADFVIMIGGAGGTYTTFKHAQSKLIPVIPLPSTEGDAYIAYNKLINSKDSLIPFPLLKDLNLSISNDNASLLRNKVKNILNTLKPKKKYYELTTSDFVTHDVTFADNNDERFGPFVVTRGLHSLSIPAPFRLGLYPVTNELYLQFVRDNGYETKNLWEKAALSLLPQFRCQDGLSSGPATWVSVADFPKERASHPVSGISYYEALAFCRWLQGAYPLDNGYVWELPTEDMWEFVARTEKGNLYPWGSEYNHNYCNSSETNIKTTSEVFAFPNGKSKDGCYDMAGNVWEFVKANDVSSGSCVLRGGSFKNNKDEIRSHLRLRNVPSDHRPNDFGFRCAQVFHENKI